MSTGWMALTHTNFAHHGVHSGFRPLSNRLEAEGVLVTTAVATLDGRRSTRPLALMRLRRQLKGTHGGVMHLFAEQTFVSSSRPSIAVVHQPPGFLQRHCAPLLDQLSGASAVVALGPRQADFLQSFTTRVALLRHGVDLEWFTPATTDHEPRSLLFIGGWLRDRPAMEQLSQAAEAHGYLVRWANAPSSPRLTDEEWLRSLQTSAAAVVAIPDAVASNAVLEAAAAGLPVLGVLSPDGQELLSQANRDFLALPLQQQLTELPHLGAQIGRANREWVAQRHRWADTAARLLELADEIHAG